MFHDVAITAIGQGGGGGLMGMMLPMVLIFGVFYFLVIRPQGKQRQKREQMLKELKKGDKVVTNGGLFGTITGIKDGIATLLVSDKVRVRVLLSQVGGLEKDFAPAIESEKD